MRRALVTLLVAHVIVAGCLAPGAPSGGNEGPQPPGSLNHSASQAENGSADGGQQADGQAETNRTSKTPSADVSQVDPASNRSGQGPSLIQRGCSTVYTSFPVRSDIAQTYLPENFTFLAKGPVGATVSGFLKAWSCGENVLDGEPLGPVASAVLYFLVEPAEAYERAEIDCDYAMGYAVTDHALVADRWRSWNLGTVQEGTVQIDIHTDLPRRTVSTEASTQDWTLEAQGMVGDPQPGEAYTCRYFGSEDGRATNAVEIPVAAGPQAAGDGLVGFPQTEPFETPGGSQRLYLQTWDMNTTSYTWSNQALAGGR